MKENKWRSLSIMDLHLSKSRGSFTSGISTATATSTSTSASSRPQSQQEVPLSSNGQSYELIKSTQSLVERLQLNAEDITIQPVHPSIIGQDTWFQITYTSSGTTRYFSCQSSKERDEWIASLKKTLMLNEDRRRTDNSLKLDILEVKGLSDKKKYYVEILIDDKLYARTTSKKISDSCIMFCESFSFLDLPFNTDKVTLLVHKDKGTTSRKTAPKKPVGRVKISVASVTSRYVNDKWYPVEKSNRRENPSVRLRAQFQSIDILPLRDYEGFLYFLKDEYKDLCKLLEPNISVKVKEELSNNFMNVFHAEDMAEDVLADLVVDEISHLENQHLTFRGNSIATKAMECYIKLVGKPYLISTLQTVIVDIIGASDLDLEIDPIKVASAEILSLNRQNLLNVVRQIWNRIVKSHAYFPVQLQRCFYKIRGYLKEVGNPDLGDKLISSCIFLRFLCPAILTPSLFNLSDEFPSEKANRNLTLVAKTLMTLANFQRYESKENSMEFLNPFLAEETETMKTFLRQISSPLSEDCWIPSLSFPVEKSDLGRYLSSLHTILFENVSKLPLDNANAVKLRKLLDDISNILKRPTIPQLELISQPTMETLKLKQDHKNSSSSGASNSENNHHPVVQTKSSRLGITIPWLGTLPKTKNKNQHHSHPAPHHEQKSTLVVSSKTSSSSSSSSSTNNTNTASATLTPSHLKSPMHGLGPSEVISLSPSDTSDSSQSLTPSPAGPMSTQRNWGGGATSTTSSSGSEILGAPSSTGRHLHDSYHHHHSKYRSASSKKIFTSSMSLDETDSSDDSTYSSQYQSDANSTPRTGTSHTLPRHLPTTRSSMMSTSVVTNQGSGGVGTNSCSVVKVKSMSDYETEILQMRSEMEQLQSKLVEAERQIQFNHVSNNHHQRNNEVEAKEVVDKLKREEDKLRREQLEMTSEDPIADKERMILMQQKKIAALDSANKRLLEELTRMTQMTSAASTKVSVITNPSTSTGLNNVTSINTSSNTVTTGAVPLVPIPQSQHDRRTSSSSTSSNKSITVITNGEASTVTSTTSPSTASTTAPTPNNHAKSNSLTQETPKTVDELLDSLHSTSI